MRQFTTTEQSAALISSGAAQPEGIARIREAGVINDRRHYTDVERAYTIGELIAMLPVNTKIKNDGALWRVDAGGKQCYAVELIDALVGAVEWTTR